MNAFEWVSAKSVEDAVKLLQPEPRTATTQPADPDEMPHAIGGGQDLLTSMKAYIVRPTRVVNLKTVPGLNQIEADASGGLKIGALVTLAELEDHPQVKSKFRGLAEAANSV